jgi:septal ring factor EnvC (AmiA/AmiB activator)
MEKIFKHTLMLVTILLTVIIWGQAQTSVTPENRPSRDNSEQDQTVAKMKERWKIEADKKEHQEMLERSDELSKLSGELSNSFSQTNSLNSEDSKKIARIEKLLSKLLDWLGGETDKDPLENKPASMAEALAQLNKFSEDLNEKLKKTSRHSISADAITEINDILKIVSYIRSNGR